MSILHPAPRGGSHPAAVVRGAVDIPAEEHAAPATAEEIDRRTKRDTRFDTDRELMVGHLSKAKTTRILEGDPGKGCGTAGAWGAWRAFRSAQSRHRSAGEQTSRKPRVVAGARGRPIAWPSPCFVASRKTGMSMRIKRNRARLLVMILLGLLAEAAWYLWIELAQGGGGKVVGY
jgi:hypothetical protein